MEYTVEFYGWANSVIITVENDEIEEYMGMVDCEIEVKNSGETIHTTTLDKIRNSMYPKTYRNHTDLYNEYAKKFNEYKITYEEYKGFGGSYTIKTDEIFDIKNLHFKFLNFNPFINVTVLEDLEYTNGDIDFNDDFDFVGKSNEETIYPFKKISTKTQQNVSIESNLGSTIDNLNNLTDMINKKIENDVESEKSIIAHSHLYDINPLDKDGNL